MVEDVEQHVVVREAEALEGNAFARLEEHIEVTLAREEPVELLRNQRSRLVGRRCWLPFFLQLKEDVTVREFKLGIKRHIQQRE